MEIVDCPTCGAPAEAQSWSFGGSAGPVPHVKLLCVRRHWYLMPRDMLVLEPDRRRVSGDGAGAAPATSPSRRA